MPKNKITTQGYFIKRLRDYGYFVCRVTDKFFEEDPRKWAVIINPNKESLTITCFKRSIFTNRGLYRLSGNESKIPKNFFISTDSIEVISKYLEEFGIEKVFNTSSDNA